MKTLTPEQAKQLVDEKGAKLVDIRSAGEYAQHHIASAVHLSLADLQEAKDLPITGEDIVIYYCLSGMRTKMNEAKLGSISCAEGYMLQGGLKAWQKAGLSVIGNASGLATDYVRQAQLIAGILVVLGYVLGVSVSAWFHLLSGFVGAGLIFAGASGNCMMAILLSKLGGKCPLK